MSKDIKKPSGPKAISKSKYFKIGIRDSARVRIIKEGMNHLFDIRNHEMEEAFYQEALRYTEEVLGTTRRIHFTEEEDQENMNIIFGGARVEVGETVRIEEEQEGAGVETEEIIDGKEEERLEREAEEGYEEAEDETLSSEEVWELNERVQAEDQEEYERIRAELEEEEAEANKHN